LKAAGFVAVSFLTFGLVSHAQAQFEVNPGQAKRQGAGRLEVSGFIGGLSIDQALGRATNIYQAVTGEAQNIDFGKLYGFRASWAFTPMLAAELNVSGGSNPYTLSVDDGVIGVVDLGEQFEADQFFLGGNVLFQFPKGNFAPYATGGVGLLRTTPQSAISGIDRISTLDINFGGGLKYWFSTPGWLGFRFDVRYHTANDGITFPGGSSTPTGLEVSVGAGVRLF